MGPARERLGSPMDDEPVMFRDRADAGRRLAERLLDYRTQDPVVLALPRGGVPVGFEIAEALQAPLDLVLVRKIGVPWQPELAAGAVADGDQPSLAVNRDVLDALGIDDAYMQMEARRQLAEIERRRALYLAGRPPVPLAGKTAIVVDDGIATGATVEAALGAVRRRAPRRVILAVPVAAPDTLARLRALVDEIVCLATPSDFGAIGVFYKRFTQLDDDAVTDLLRRAHAARERPAAPEGSPGA